MEVTTANREFVDSLIREIIEPGVQELMESRYFSELREGKLSVGRLQGFSLQHYLHNIAICKGFTLCMVKNAHNQEVYGHFLHQLNEEQDHPDLAKGFGLALGLQEADFDEALPIVECRAHTGAVLHGMFLGSIPENRTSALVNETMVGRYAEEFDIYLRRRYELSDGACEFFAVHRVADKEHTREGAEIVAQ